jgi:hypothetical protein
MDKKLLKQIIAQQVVILQRLEKLEHEVRGGSRLAAPQAYVDELIRSAERIVDHIEI